ncbi:2-oxoglutarate and iron dependent oxygenase [Aureococcus anophagefferens]|uniref:2-oxoglutarate and iron dependent oxygenase n=1 Tax=Aureococcus anophagefferens TaxID=44056 RepID=A0ABR1G7D9_AURAN
MAEGRTSEAPIVIQDDDEANQPAKRAAEVIVIDDADDDPAAKRRRTADDDDASLALARELQSQDDARAREPLPARGGAGARRPLDAIASIFVNYHEERQAFVAKTEAADLIEQNVAEMMGVVYRGASRVAARAARRVLPLGQPARRAASANASRNRRRARAGRVASPPSSPRSRRTSQIADEGGPATHQLVAATLLIQFVVLPRKMGTGRDSLEFDFVLMLCRRLGVKDVFLFATEAGAPAWLTLGFEHVGSSASLIHLRFDLLFKRDRGVLARSARHDLLAAPSPPRASSPPAPPAAPSPSALADASSPPPLRGGRRADAAEAAEPLEAAPPAPAPRRCAAASKKRVVDDADADDEDEAWEPGRPSMMDLDDDEQEQAAKAKRKLKRRSKKKSAKAKNAAGAAPHAPEQERNAFLERIQAEEVRREQARIAAARPVPPPPNRDRRGRRQRRGFEESDNDDPVEDLIHRERIRERDLLRTPGCLALGRKAFRLEDMPRVTERDREILRRVLYILREAERPSTRSRSTRTSSSRGVDMEVRRSTVGVYEDSLACQLLGQTYYVHPDKTIKITVDLVVTSEVIGAFRVRGGRRSAREIVFLAGTAPGRAEVQIKELGFHFVDPLAPIAEKEIVPRVRVFIPYLGIEGWISITSRGPALDDGHLIVELKYLQAMHVKNRMLKKCCYTLYLLELADRLRGEASRETLKTARKNVVEAEGEYQLALSNYRQMELWCFFKATLVADGAKKVKFDYCKKGNANGTDYLIERFRGLAETDPLRLEFDELARARAYAQPECGVRYPYGSKLGLFKGRVGGGARCFERLASVSSETRVRERLDAFDSTPPRESMCYRVIRDAKRRIANHLPRAEDDQCPAYYGVDYRSLERYKADFALQLKDLACAEAADEAYLRDQAAALAPPEPMPDGSRPPIDAHSRRTAASTAAVANFYRDPCGLLEPRAPPARPAARRVAKLYVVPNCEVVSPPPPPIYHVTENGERLLVLYATRVQRPLIPAIQQVHKQRAEFLSLFDESEVEMAAAMFDSRPIEIARPLLFESEEDGARARPRRPRPKRSASRAEEAQGARPLPVSFRTR